MGEMKEMREREMRVQETDHNDLICVYIYREREREREEEREIDRDEREKEIKQI